MPLGDKARAALLLRAATLKQQAMITRQSGERQASLKPALVRQAISCPDLNHNTNLGYHALKHVAMILCADRID